jgi:hypothetical protein
LFFCSFSTVSSDIFALSSLFHKHSPASRLMFHVKHQVSIIQTKNNFCLFFIKISSAIFCCYFGDFLRFLSDFAWFWRLFWAFKPIRGIFCVLKLFERPCNLLFPRVFSQQLISFTPCKTDSIYLSLYILESRLFDVSRETMKNIHFF